KNSERPGHPSVASSTSVAPPLQSSCAGVSEEHIDYIYTPGELPRVRQMWYCICDIRLPVAEEIVRKDYFIQGETADLQNGWLPSKVIDRVRHAIKEDVCKLSTQIEDEEGIPMDNEEDWWAE
ncbi:unnamed protein product, partial [Gongylonema pulchrum]|uniref:AXIN2 n=1 Tax=Gongylonema pulchrum TaxID=637853 RepID=A0A183EP53_9BILA